MGLFLAWLFEHEAWTFVLIPRKELDKIEMLKVNIYILYQSFFWIVYLHERVQHC